MNVSILVLVGAGGTAALWAAQTVLLVRAQEPWRVGLLRHGSATPSVRWGMKVALQSVLLALVFGFPALVGEEPLGYHRDRLLPASWLLLAGVVASVVLGFSVPFALNVAVGWVKISPRQGVASGVRKAVRGLLSPLPLAFVEEAVFRGVVLDQLLRAMPSREGMVVALVLSSAGFASVHFFRKQKRVFLPAVGLFGLGLMLGTVYVAGGYSYWLPVGIHAGGILFIQVWRPFVVYRGPAGLIGYSSYPMCGLLGLFSMAAYATILVYWLKGGVAT